MSASCALALESPFKGKRPIGGPSPDLFGGPVSDRISARSLRKGKRPIAPTPFWVVKPPLYSIESATKNCAKF